MQLLQHFKELTIHPKNSKELKGLILQLAVQGKLTQQWRADNLAVEPASVLIEEIKEKKEQLSKEKKIKKEKPLPLITPEEIPYQLPSSWEWCRLGTYIHNFGQKKPNKKFEYIDVASVDNRRGVLIEDLNIISPSEAPSRARKIVQSGCVIYSTVRPYLLNIAVIDRDFSPEAIASTAFAVLNPLLDCSEYYLYHTLRSLFFIEYVESCMKGVAYPAINDSNLLKGVIPIPPIEEQKAIVETVNQLFAEVEQLEEQTRARIQLKEDFVTSALLDLATKDTADEWSFLQPHFQTFFTEKSAVKNLRETVLQLAVQGKLTQKWRASRKLSGQDVEPAAVLLEKIKAEKEQLIKEKKIKKEKPLPAITEEEMPYELPEGWEWCRMRDLSYSIVPNRDKPKSFTGGITWLTTRNLSKKHSHIIHLEADKKLSSSEIKEYNARLLPPYSVVMSCVGQFGQSAVLDKEYSCNQQLHCFVPLGHINSFYINYLIKNGESVYKDMANATTIAYLNKTKCESLLVSLPPSDEQKTIVEMVKSLMALCDQLEQEIEQNTQQVEQLMQSCLKEVFEGN